MLKQRSGELEIMDDLDINGPVIDQTLKELDVINRRLGGNQISLSSFENLLKTHNISSVADLGCGGGDILIEMANIAFKRKKKTSFIGFDANPHIIEYARNHTKQWPNITFEAENIFDAAFQKKHFDLIHCCLFLHHFTEDELVSLFRQFKTQAKVAIVVNDLQRHWLAYYSIKLITRFFSKSYMVRNDAAVSVARGFHRAEWKTIMQKAGIHQYELKWRWAFRWQLVIIL
ncbi:MAG: 2-polyprenyl-3-methyl-5-hydroxy-6-metoxy-1,4-benzoquinol methylase [Cyclobacteriaceae bacterium]|jgi:2-polyprenyl-3-methyl-5-hydroxy-6-metoxy-1,4-benzoquinol methylase